MAKDFAGEGTHRAVDLLKVLRRLGGSARTKQLAVSMDVSEETVRRTVKALSKEGRVSRVHGGVYLAGIEPEMSFYRRISEHASEKRDIARATVEHIDDGASLFLDVGTTTAFVAEALRIRSDLLVVTNSLNAVQTLANHSNNRVFLAGGEVRQQERGAFGADVLNFISRFNPDFAILSVDAIDVERGFLLHDHAEAEIAEAFTRLARQKIVVCDHHKFTRSALMSIGDPAMIDQLVTDTAPPAHLSEAFRKWDVEVLVAPEKSKRKQKT